MKQDQNTQQVKTLWAKAQAEELAVGWTYDCLDIAKVRDEASMDCGYDATMEFTESVMKIAETRLRAIFAEVQP